MSSTRLFYSSQRGLRAPTGAAGRLRRGLQVGMTMLEIMIVLAIIAGGALLVRTGFRLVTKADLAEGAIEVTNVLHNTADLAKAKAVMHRVVFDFDKHALVVEACQGAKTIRPKEPLQGDPAADARAMERAQERLRQMPADALATGDMDAAAKRASALAGQHIGDRTCAPVKEAVSGDAQGRGWLRQLRADKGIKIKKIYAQHLPEPQSSGQVALYFFADGSAEKAVVELTDGSAVFSILVHGLTGQVELTDEELRSPDDHMLRDPRGEATKARQGDQ